MEKLSAKKELEIKDEEITRMQEIKNSSNQVPICSGCTLWTEMPLNSLFDPKTKGIISASADNWFDHYYKYFYKKKRKQTVELD
jgi:hypothetical protein